MIRSIAQVLARRSLQGAGFYGGNAHMWRCSKCNFLYVARESPERCKVCTGEGFIEVLIKNSGSASRRSRQEPGAESRSTFDRADCI